jgi:hypothetical protein
VVLGIFRDERGVKGSFSLSQKSADDREFPGFWNDTRMRLDMWFNPERLDLQIDAIKNGGGFRRFIDGTTNKDWKRITGRVNTAISVTWAGRHFLAFVRCSCYFVASSCTVYILPRSRGESLIVT